MKKLYVRNDSQEMTIKILFEEFLIAKNVSMFRRTQYLTMKDVSKLSASILMWKLPVFP